MKLEHYIEKDGNVFRVKTKYTSQGEYVEQGVTRATELTIDAADRRRVVLNEKEYGGVE